MLGAVITVLLICVNSLVLTTLLMSSVDLCDTELVIRRVTCNDRGPLMCRVIRTVRSLAGIML